MMVIIWTVIKLLDAPEQLPEATSAKETVTIQYSTRMRSYRQTCTVLNTMQSHYSGKARGQDTVHSTVPQTASLSYYLLSVEKNLPLVKADYPPWFPPDFQQSPDSIQGSLLLYKAAFDSVFSRLTSPKSSQSFLHCTLNYICNQNGSLLFPLSLPMYQNYICNLFILPHRVCPDRHAPPL